MTSMITSRWGTMMQLRLSLNIWENYPIVKIFFDVKLNASHHHSFQLKPQYSIANSDKNVFDSLIGTFQF